jgi:hypothetical protein
MKSKVLSAGTRVLPNPWIEVPPSLVLHETGKQLQPAYCSNIDSERVDICSKDDKD